MKIAKPSDKIPRPANTPSSSASLAWEMDMNYTEIECAECGKTFRGKKRYITGPRFCSGKCKMRYHRRNGRFLIEAECPVCGKKFKVDKYVYNAGKTKTCGARCGQLYRLRANSGENHVNSHVKALI